MFSTAKTPEEYIELLPEERRVAITELRRVILENLPEGFEECVNYGMISYVVPHSLYPEGYHVDPVQPLPFISLASQKNHIAVYHMGIYADEELLSWFKNEYAKNSKSKLDMGKSCIRFKNIDKIPYPLIGTLAGKMTPEYWISLYSKTKS